MLSVVDDVDMGLLAARLHNHRTTTPRLIIMYARIDDGIRYGEYWRWSAALQTERSNLIQNSNSYR